MCVFWLRCNYYYISIEQVSRLKRQPGGKLQGEDILDTFLLETKPGAACSMSCCTAQLEPWGILPNVHGSDPIDPVIMGRKSQHLYNGTVLTSNIWQYSHVRLNLTEGMFVKPEARLKHCFWDVTRKKPQFIILGFVRNVQVFSTSCFHSCAGALKIHWTLLHNATVLCTFINTSWSTWCHVVVTPPSCFSAELKEQMKFLTLFVSTWV